MLAEWVARLWQVSTQCSAGSGLISAGPDRGHQPGPTTRQTFVARLHDPSSEYTNQHLALDLMSAHVQPTDFSAEDFFSQQPTPPGLDAVLSQVQEFVERNASQGRKVVLITVSPTSSSG